MIFQVHFKSGDGSYSYVVAACDSEEAILIDPTEDCIEGYAQLLARLDYTLRYTLETGSVRGASKTARKLSDEWGCSAVVPCDAQRGGSVIRVGHRDELRLARLGIDVVGRPGGLQQEVSFRVDDRIFTGALIIRGEDEIRALPSDTLVYRSREVRGSNFGLLGIESGSGLRDRESWQGLRIPSLPQSGPSIRH
jgi:glyoxylase-like metal-dependent hydrolase (beta-lactamase superfamily II)